MTGPGAAGCWTVVSIVGADAVTVVFGISLNKKYTYGRFIICFISQADSVDSADITGAGSWFNILIFPLKAYKKHINFLNFQNFVV